MMRSQESQLASCNVLVVYMSRM